jgi:hypothetical protein
MLGRPNCMVPVFISSWPGAWLKASVHRFDDGDIVHDLREVRQQGVSSAPDWP